MLDNFDLFLMRIVRAREGVWEGVGWGGGKSVNIALDYFNEFNIFIRGRTVNIALDYFNEFN